jgi:hypothetical protein
MADVFDQAEITSEMFLKAAIQSAKSKSHVDTHNATGFCWNCGEPTGNQRRFCDQDCATDYERRND